jgi:hypothetical protein
MQIHWQVVEAVGVWAVAIIGVIHLRYLWGYLSAARDQAKAAFRQAEGLLKPVVVVASTTTIPVDPSASLSEEIPTEIYGDFVRLINIGNGPALGLAWSYQRVRGNVRGKCSYLAPHANSSSRCRSRSGRARRSSTSNTRASTTSLTFPRRYFVIASSRKAPCARPCNMRQPACGTPSCRS